MSRDLLGRRVQSDCWKVAEAPFAAGMSERTTYRWLARFEVGEPLTGRSSRPQSIPNRTPVKVEIAIELLRRQRWMTSSAIAAKRGIVVETVCAVLARLGLNRLSWLDAVEPANRHARRHAGG